MKLGLPTPCSGPARRQAPRGRTRSGALLEHWKEVMNKATERLALRPLIQTRLRERRVERAISLVPTSPRYDEVFEDGVRWLNSLAGPSLPDVLAEAIADKLQGA